ncbi:uncharacterized protein LOC131232644 [Magnolia sinica]|uniref:uncharacterized protein LOC131232644 n=1 Tax=Magnolia sinica TaxID=86752 RepID=UPI00265827D9|nr:uncharacterized protein LOC131232644 [Magnolia sinica]
METLVVWEQYRNRYYSRNKLQISDRLSSPSRSFREINCRTFQSGAGILPSPSSIPVKTSESHITPVREKNENICRKSSSAISIKTKPTDIENPFDPESLSSSYSELWAGPAYSNSPPPSSLPIPKFSLRQKRSISLDSPIPVCGFTVHPIAKSAPSSPSRESCSSSASNLFLNTAATENLRRILHLDIADD